MGCFRTVRLQECFARKSAGREGQRLASLVLASRSNFLVRWNLAYSGPSFLQAGLGAEYRILFGLVFRRYSLLPGNCPIVWCQLAMSLRPSPHIGAKPFEKYNLIGRSQTIGFPGLQV